MIWSFMFINVIGLNYLAAAAARRPAECGVTPNSAALSKYDRVPASLRSKSDGKYSNDS